MTTAHGVQVAERGLLVAGYWHEPTPDEHALAKLIQVGDWLECATSLGHEWTGTAAGE